VITSAEAAHQGMHPGTLRITRVEPDQVGIVTTLDGASIEAGEIAGPAIEGHENFQNGNRLSTQRTAWVAGTNSPVGHMESESMVRAGGRFRCGDSDWLCGVVISFVGKAHLM